MINRISFTLILFLGMLPSINAQDAKQDQSLSNEVMPDFPGGVGELYKFIKKNIRYANDYDKKYQGRVGKVFVVFIIEQDGSINDSLITIQRSTIENSFYSDDAIRNGESYAEMEAWNTRRPSGQSSF
jgi:hypothetical protein